MAVMLQAHNRQTNYGVYVMALAVYDQLVVLTGMQTILMASLKAWTQPWCKFSVFIMGEFHSLKEYFNLKQFVQLWQKLNKRPRITDRPFWNSHFNRQKGSEFRHCIYFLRNLDKYGFYPPEVLKLNDLI